MNSQANSTLLTIGISLAVLSLGIGTNSMLARGYHLMVFALYGLLIVGIICVFAACKNRGRGDPAPYSALVIGNTYEVIFLRQDISEMLLLNRSSRYPEGDTVLITLSGFPSELKKEGLRFLREKGGGYKIIA
jgi:hypothetical protein